MPRSTRLGARRSSRCSCFRVISLLSLSFRSKGQRATSRSRASTSTKLTAGRTVAKLRDTNDVYVSGKLVNQSPLRKSISFSWSSNSARFLHASAHTHGEVSQSVRQTDRQEADPCHDIKSTYGNHLENKPQSTDFQ